MTLRVIGPWRNGEAWLTAENPKPPNALTLLPLDSWVDSSISMDSTTLPWQLCRICSSVVMFWCGKSLLRSSIGGCLSDRALNSFDSQGYWYSCGLSYRLSWRYFPFELTLSWSGVFLACGELTGLVMAGLSPPCSRGSLFTSRSGDRAVLLGLGVLSSTSSANELHLFRDSVNGRLRRNSRETVLQSITEFWKRYWNAVWN